jgi:hypothetical protein
LTSPASNLPKITLSKCGTRIASVLRVNQEEIVMRTKWDIRREGRAWRGGEGMKRFTSAPNKIEMIGGKLFSSDEDRVTMLGLLLENVGADAAVRLGDPAVWRAAVGDL